MTTFSRTNTPMAASGVMSGSGSAIGSAVPRDVDSLERISLRLEGLLAVSAELLRRTDESEIGDVVVHAALDTLGARTAGLWTIAKDGNLALIAKAGDNAATFAADAGPRVDQSSRARQPSFGDDDNGDCIGAMPLVIEGRVIGCLAVELACAPPADDDRALVELLARHTAQALDRARLLQAESRARLEAERASRAREDVLSVVSHDLRNPLSAILMAAGTLAKSEHGARVQANAERIQRNVERMTRLIDDLVDFSAIRAGQLALRRGDYAPDAIVRATVEMFAPLAEEAGKRVEAFVEGPIPPISCDHDRVVQAIANLVSNAMKVTAVGGVITVSASLQDHEVHFSVSDNGPGIKADELPHLFDRYFRGTGATYKGTGLGLSITKGIVEAHGGHIWADSVVGAGATFTFSIPNVVVS